LDEAWAAVVISTFWSLWKRRNENVLMVLMCREIDSTTSEEKCLVRLFSHKRLSKGQRVYAVVGK